MKAIKKEDIELLCLSMLSERHNHPVSVLPSAYLQYEHRRQSLLLFSYILFSIYQDNSNIVVLAGTNYITAI